MPDAPHLARCLCGGTHIERAWEYDAPPAGETHFAATDGRYHRRVMRCRACGHFLLDPGVDIAELYRGAYAEATYGTRMREVFERITNLPPEASDNHGRVARILEFAEVWLSRPQMEGRAPRALDVGSGLAVFPWALTAQGWSVLALDPDPRQVELAHTIACVPAVCGDFMTVTGLGRFDLVTLNKVLEHVPDPVAMLARTVEVLEPGGFVYLEVPDGDGAAADGPHREEFFIEHLHVFTHTSVSMLIAASGLSALRVLRLREPSGKYTFAAFCAVPVVGGHDDERRALRQIAVANPGGPAAAWAAIEEPRVPGG